MNSTGLVVLVCTAVPHRCPGLFAAHPLCTWNTYSVLHLVCIPAFSYLHTALACTQFVRYPRLLCMCVFTWPGSSALPANMHQPLLECHHPLALQVRAMAAMGRRRGWAALQTSRASTVRPHSTSHMETAQLGLPPLV